MDLNTFVAEIVGIVPPWRVVSAEFDGVDTVDVEIEYVRTMRSPAPCCPECGGRCSYYDMVDKSWRHTDMCDQICRIHGKVPRIRCGGCGKVSRMEVPWASESISRYTSSFESKVVGLAREMPVSAVCREMRIDDSTVWTILDRYVARRMEGQDLSAVSTYYVDEKAIHKGHTYLSTFLDQNRDVIYVGEGNSSDTVSGFRDHLESRGGTAGGIRHISSDMGSGYLKGARECFPDARVTLDRFHVTKHMTEAVNDTRRREYAALTDGQAEERAMLKGQRYLFLKNYNNLDDSRKEILPGLLAAFPDLGRIYVFKESMRGFWEMPTRYDGGMFVRRWCSEARATDVPELVRIVNMVEGILNWYDSRISNGVMEAFNSVLQAFKGRARGYRSLERYRTMIYLRSCSLCRDDVRGRCPTPSP